MQASRAPSALSTPWPCRPSDEHRTKRRGWRVTALDAASGPGPRARASVAGVALLAAGIAVVVLTVAAVHSGGHWSDGSAGIAIDGGSFALVRGGGHRQGTAFVLDSTDGEGMAVLSARV